MKNFIFQALSGLLFLTPTLVWAECASSQDVAKAYQAVQIASNPSQKQVDHFIEVYTSAVDACPRMEKTYLREMKVSDFNEARTQAVSHWFLTDKSGSKDLTMLSTDSAPKDLGSYDLSPEVKARLLARQKQAQDENAGRLQALEKAPVGACSDKNNVGKLGPLLFQGSTGLCASFMTADLLTAEYGKPISPFSLAVGLGRNDLRGNKQTQVGEHPDDYGFEVNASRGAEVPEPLVTAAESGVCYESDMPSNLDQIWKNADAVDVIMLIRGIDRGSLPTSEGVCNATTSQLHMLFPSLSMDELTQILSSAQGKIMQAAFASCRQKVPPLNLKNYQYSRFRLGAEDLDLKKKILDQALDGGGVAGTAISTHLYEDPKNAGKDKPNHAVTIVGRRKNPKTGQCEYLVRNSLGDMKVRQGIGKPKDPPYDKYSEGHTWIPESALLPSLDEVIAKKAP